MKTIDKNLEKGDTQLSEAAQLKLPNLPAKLPFGKASTKEHIISYSQLEELRHLLHLTLGYRSMGLITGEAGTGKTTAVRTVTDELPSNKYSIIYLGQDQDGSNLCRRLSHSLGLKPRLSRTHTLLAISQHLSDNCLEQGREVILVVDEAHLLDNATLEDVRLLTNNNFDSHSPLSVILVGQLPLRTRLKGIGFEALNQRLRFRYSLEGFSEQETERYIRHHMLLIDSPEDFFEPTACKLIFQASRGVIREINNFALLSFLKACSKGLKHVDAKLVKQVLDQRELN
jgi:type II secretory pathway predicted ATPase ExeA